jgi:hypothetical protein
MSELEHATDLADVLFHGSYSGSPGGACVTLVVTTARSDEPVSTCSRNCVELDPNLNARAYSPYVRLPHSGAFDAAAAAKRTSGRTLRRNADG